jgi:hypothetical protein
MEVGVSAEVVVVIVFTGAALVAIDSIRDDS